MYTTCHFPDCKWKTHGDELGCFVAGFLYCPLHEDSEYAQGLRGPALYPPQPRYIPARLQYLNRLKKNVKPL